jgi:hypothetical protein
MPRRSDRQAEILAHEEAVEFYNALSETRQRSFMPEFVYEADRDRSDEGSNSDFWMAREEMQQDEDMFGLDIDLELTLMEERTRLDETIDGQRDDDGSDPQDSPRTRSQRRIDEINAHRYRFRN